MNLNATSPGTDAGAGAAAAGSENADTLDADLEAMRLAEEADDDDAGPAGGTAAPQEGGKAKAADPAQKTGDELKPELTVDELRERHRQKAAALREERAARQSQDAVIAELKAEIAALRQGRTPAPAAGAQPSGADEDDGSFDLDSFEIPDPREDPQGAFLAMSKVAAALLEERRQGARQATEQQTQTQVLQQLTTQFRSAEQEYAKVQPDYYDAVKHLRESRIEELKIFGYQDQVAKQMFAREILQLVNAAMSTQDHPAHIIYEMSKRRGFAGRAADPGAGNGAGGQPAPAAAEVDAGKAAADMKQRIEATKLGKTLSGAGGKVTPNVLTVDAVNAIEDGDEFDKAFAELARANKGR